MKALNYWFSLAVLALATGCASQPREKPVQVQGWIGGSYQRAESGYTVADRFIGTAHTIHDFPHALVKLQPGGIFVSKLGTNTPAYQAGLRPGDLILTVAHQPVMHLPEFWQVIHSATPGTPLPIKAWRAGKTMEYDITMGREKYREAGNLSIGLPGFFESSNLIPRHDNPYFSLVALGWQGNVGSSADLDSVEQHYRLACHPKQKPEGYEEEWKSWLAIIQVAKGKTIIAQELVTTGPSAPLAQ